MEILVNAPKNFKGKEGVKTRGDNWVKQKPKKKPKKIKQNRFSFITSRKIT